MILMRTNSLKSMVAVSYIGNKQAVDVLAERYFILPYNNMFAVCISCTRYSTFPLTHFLLFADFQFIQSSWCQTFTEHQRYVKKRMRWNRDEFRVFIFCALPVFTCARQNCEILGYVPLFPTIYVRVKT
jgi:hypothetical protein